MEQIKSSIMKFFGKQCTEEIACTPGLGKVAWIELNGKRLTVEEFRKLNETKNDDDRVQN